MVMLKVQELPAGESLSGKGRCAGLFIHGHGGQRLEDGQRPKRMGR